MQRIKAKIDFRNWDYKSEYYTHDNQELVQHRFEEDRDRVYFFRSIDTDEEIYMLEDETSDVRDGAIFFEEEIIRI